LIGIISIKTLGILSCSGNRERNNFNTNIEVEHQNKDTVTKIEIKKVDFGILTIADVDCIDFEYIFNSDMDITTVEKKDSINLFMEIISNLLRDTAKCDFNYSPDVRAKLLIYHNNNTIDTLCMDGWRIMLNQELYIMDERLLKMIEKL
jgi:hypothetical protein